MILERQLAALRRRRRRWQQRRVRQRAAALESTSDAAAEGRALPLSTGGHLARRLAASRRPAHIARDDCLRGGAKVGCAQEVAR